jgi:hypothetical protein
VQHVDPDRLAFLALGEPPADADAVVVAAHLRECGACRDEVAVLRHVVELARDTVRHADDARPPEAVWDRIAGQTGIGAPRPLDLPRPLGPGGPPAGVRARPTRPDRRHAAPRPRWPRTAAALVAAAAVGVLGTLGTLRPWQSDPQPVVASSAVLAPVAGGPGGASGRAVVVRTPTGPELRISATRLPLQQGYYEVWVYDGQRKMHSVGVLGAGSTAVLPLPPTLDLRTYPVVDISAEQYDGDQTHSETSVLRGTLTG